ncbi:sulfotransferase 1C1-like [Leptodactylus fuscus]|uniref:sulfotransferase 1C1-like n=1 Tax=Leptodactylus fuscus TaxID=238119 RepID=UPI003F4EA36B
MERPEDDSMDYSTILENVPEGTFYRFPLIPIHGVPLMKPIADSWERIEKFQARPDDILISTYPKAGTTWMQEIVDSIMNEGEVEKTSRAPTHVRSPFLEICSPPPVPSGIDLLEVTPSPRLVKTHLMYELTPESFWHQKCKVIYVARNAKDNAVSYYYFDKMNKTQPDPGTWDEYVIKYLKGDVAWGSWFSHVLGWWNARHKHDILYMFYEDMKEDPKREIRKVMKFLGKDLSEDVVEKIYRHTSFDTMKDNPMANYSSIPSNVLDQSLSPFMRKGEVGDWMNHFTESQNKIFDEEYQKKMAGSTLKFRYKI